MIHWHCRNRKHFHDFWFSASLHLSLQSCKLIQSKTKMHIPLWDLALLDIQLCGSGRDGKEPITKVLTAPELKPLWVWSSLSFLGWACFLISWPPSKATWAPLNPHVYPQLFGCLKGTHPLCQQSSILCSAFATLSYLKSAIARALNRISAIPQVLCLLSQFWGAKPVSAPLVQSFLTPHCFSVHFIA